MGEALRRRVLVVLCLTQITSWGVLYYAFPVMAPTLAADTGWSVPSDGGVLGRPGGLRAGGDPGGAGARPVRAALVMTWRRRWGPRGGGVATAGSFWLFAVAWLLVGVGMPGTLYPPAFAALTRWWGGQRVGR